MKLLSLSRDNSVLFTVQPSDHVKNNVAPSDNNRTLHSFVNSCCCFRGRYCVREMRLICSFSERRRQLRLQQQRPLPISALHRRLVQQVKLTHPATSLFTHPGASIDFLCTSGTVAARASPAIVLHNMMGNMMPVITCAL